MAKKKKSSHINDPNKYINSVGPATLNVAPPPHLSPFPNGVTISGDLQVAQNVSNDVIWSVNSDGNGNIGTVMADNFIYYPKNITCCACGKAGEQGYSYTGVKIVRHICKKCHTKALDKMFGVSIDIDLEDTLYSK
jgi:hypothetical protein